MQGQISFPRHAINVASSSLGKDLKNYVYFSNDTRGTVGRAVKINPDLFAPFLAMVDLSSFQGRNVIKAITDLRATAGHLNSQANARNSFEYRLMIENVTVRYRVCSEEIGAKGTVYITQIAPGGRSTDKSGFYAISRMMTSASTATKEYNSTKFTHSTVYINGSAQSSIAEAATASLKQTGQGSCLLAFNNGETQSDLSIWKKSPNASGKSKQFIAKLTEALELNAGEKKEWVVEGEGVALLLEAISNAKGDSRKDLSYEKNQFSNYKFRLVNPVGDTAKLLSLLRLKKAELPEKLLTFDSPTRASKVSSLTSHYQINQVLSALGSRSDYNREVTRKFNSSLPSGAVGGIKAAQNTTNAGSTFIQAITLANKAIK